MLILIIPEISHSLCFLIPRIPHHCIRKAIFPQNKCPLFFMINDCNLCRSTKIYLINLSFQEKEKDQLISKKKKTEKHISYTHVNIMKY
ncbi:hypothetical protein MtrunA17_Chr2g0298111 [Medicago truncatula]|uniref:Uncharacterized protein n=1 Tax=Medicago truncatula TaxID=3880 RepID=A0A396JE17_MEDTR|nr:hypothetical protein MtrunA17_Chr2g0298111 [Medicago truncatula]